MDWFRGLQVCHSLYFFLHNPGAGQTRYKNSIKHFDENGMTPRIYGLRNIVNWKNQITEEEAQQIVAFIRNLATAVAIELPGRMPNHKDFRVLKLPSNKNKTAWMGHWTEPSLGKYPPRHIWQITSDFFKINHIVSFWFQPDVTSSCGPVAGPMGHPLAGHRGVEAPTGNSGDAPAPQFLWSWSTTEDRHGVDLLAEIEL